MVELVGMLRHHGARRENLLPDIHTVEGDEFDAASAARLARHSYTR